MDEQSKKPTDRFATLPKEGMSAQEFLCWSMDRHAEVKTFEARVQVAGLQGQKRQIKIELPNRYRIRSSSSGFEMTSTCDGEKVIEYGSRRELPVMTYPAPDSVASVSSMLMSHPMFCGSLLYRFFAGSQGLDQLAWLERAPIEYGNTEKAGGEIATVVKFYGREHYGNMHALIGLKSGLVHRIAYDSAEIYKFMSDPSVRQRVRSAATKGTPWKRAMSSFGLWVAGSPLMKRRWSTHTFEDIALNRPIPTADFDTSPPDDRVPVDTREKGKPPVPIGDPAPNFKVEALDGRTVRLSMLQGHVVFIDLWATWCGPCREGLPDTLTIAAEGLREDFLVLAISNETPDVIAKFIKEEKLNGLPVYADTFRDVWTRYQVQAIPTSIVIDAEGNLAAYMVGLRPKEEILAAIRAAKGSQAS